SLPEQAPDGFGLRPDLFHAADAPLAAARLLDQEVVPGRLPAHDLAGPGDPEPLGRSAVRLHLRHDSALNLLVLRLDRLLGRLFRPGAALGLDCGLGLDCSLAVAALTLGVVRPLLDD